MLCASRSGLFDDFEQITVAARQFQFYNHIRQFGEHLIQSG